MKPLHCIWALAAAAPLWPSDALDQWRRDAEQLSQAPITTLRVEADPARGRWRWPDSAEPAAVIRAYLSDDAFRTQLRAAHALTLNYEGPEGRHHVIFLNGALAGQWQEQEEGLLAHEIGHVWLHARGFRSPRFPPGPGACIAIHAGDIPQHVLIRAEMRRRGIAGDGYWRGNLRLAIGTPPPRVLDPCQRLIVLSQWMDARLGASPDDWDEWECFEAEWRKRFPGLLPVADRLEAFLREADLSTPEAFARVVVATRAILESVFEATLTL